MLKPVKSSCLNLFSIETMIIKEIVIYSFNFNKIICDFQRVLFWLASAINVTKMKLFVS